MKNALVVCAVVLLGGCAALEEWAEETPVEQCLREYQLAIAVHCNRAGQDVDIACIRLMQADRDRCLALAMPAGAPPLPPVPAVGPIDGEELAATILFELDRSELDATARTQITLAAARAIRESGRPIEVRGHADVTGEREHNVELSHARAVAVRDALIAAGVDAERIAAGGYGALEPRAPASTDEGRARSRAAEIVLLPVPRTNS